MPTLTLKQQQIFYTHNQVDADLPTVLLIHGAGGCVQSWPYQWQQRFAGRRSTPRFLTDFPLVLVDLPGHGRSAPPSRQSIDAYADDVLALIDGLKLKRVVVGGHSMGGAIAQTIAIRQPDVLAGLLLLGTGAKMPVSDSILNGLRTDFVQTVQLINKFSWHQEATPSYKQVAMQHMLNTGADVVHGDFFACSQFDVREKVAQIEVPTLVVAGDSDKMMSLPFSQFLVDNIPDARLAVIENAGHFMMVEKTSKTTQAIVEFLGEAV